MSYEFTKSLLRTAAIAVPAMLAGAGAMAQKIIAAMQKPYSVAGRESTVTASVGVAVHKSGDLETADLLARADRAMYTAKRAGNNRMSVA